MTHIQVIYSCCRLLLSVVAALLLLALLPSATQAGNGRYKDGKYRFCISVRFKATDAQLLKIRETFQRGSNVFYEATNGQQWFDQVSIVNAIEVGGVVVPQASESAEVWIHPGRGRANASINGFGVRGRHINLYFDSDFQARAGVDGDAFTVAHEMAHQSFGVRDEYSGPGISDGADCAVRPEPATLNYCLMDNYYKRGGRLAGGGYTLTEFCQRAGHDPDRNTYQSRSNGGKACWETIASHPARNANMPAGPRVAPLVAPVVNFHEGFGGLRAMLVIDRSGSMSSAERMVFARAGGKVFVDALRVGDGIGLIDFDDDITVTYPLTTITSEAIKSAVKAKIDTLTPDGSTNIGDALLAAMAQLTGQQNRSCNEIIVLLTDGDHNSGTPPSAVLSRLKDAGITVLTVGLGTSISVSGEGMLRLVASESGGKYYRVANGFGLLGLSLQLVEETRNNGLLARAPLKLTSGQTAETTVLVESGAKGATFSTAIADPKDIITMSLLSPSGLLITDLSRAPNVRFTTDPNGRKFEIDAPEAGNWKVILRAGTIVNGQSEINVFAENDGTQLVVSTRKSNVGFPEPIVLEATPMSQGFNVLGAVIQGEVVRPDGSTTAISLYDDGRADHADGVAGDGTYSAFFFDYNKDGTYAFELKLNVGATAITAEGEEIHASEPSSSIPVAPFTRIASATAVVSGVKSSFGLAITPDAQSVTAGTSTSYRIDVQPFLGFTQPVAMSVTMSPTGSGINASLSSTTVTPGNSSTLNVTTAANATPGLYTLTIRGSAGTLTSTVTATLDVVRGPSFTINSLTPSQSPVGVVPKRILIRGSDIPAGSTAFLDSTPVTPKKVTSTKAVIKALPANLFQSDRVINIKIVDANGFFSNTLTFTVGTGIPPIPPSVNLTLSSSSMSLRPAASGNVTVNINRQNFTGNVSLGLNGLPAGASADFDPPATTGNSSLLRITTGSTVTPGNYPLTINGSAAGLTIPPIIMTLIVEQTGAVRLTASPPQLSLTAGESGNVNIGIDRTNFTGEVRLSMSGLPADMTHSLSPPATTGNSALMTITSTTASTPGTYTLTISGSAPGITVASTTVVVQVSPPAATPNVKLSASPSSRTIRAGQSADFTIALARTNFTGAVRLEIMIRASTVPGGLSARLTENPATGNAVTLSLSTTSSFVPGTYIFFVRGTANGATVENTQDFTLVVQ